MWKLRSAHQIKKERIIRIRSSLLAHSLDTQEPLDTRHLTTKCPFVLPVGAASEFTITLACDSFLNGL